MPDKETIAWYDGAAEKYAGRFGKGEAGERLLAFMAALPTGANVLDLGCGPARASALMRDAGLHPVAVDASPGMVDLANSTYDIDAQIMTFDDLDMSDAFDGVWANFSLLHAPRTALPRHFAAIARALREAGILHVAMKTGSGQARDTLGRQYTYVTVKELSDLLFNAGFEVLHVHEGRETGCAGTEDPFVAIRARKR